MADIILGQATSNRDIRAGTPEAEGLLIHPEALRAPLQASAGLSGLFPQLRLGSGDVGHRKPFNGNQWALMRAIE
jgi:hypothetical protein